MLTFGQITSCCMRRGYAKGNLIMKRPNSENGAFRKPSSYTGSFTNHNVFITVAFSLSSQEGSFRDHPMLQKTPQIHQ